MPVSFPVSVPVSCSVKKPQGQIINFLLLGCNVPRSIQVFHINFWLNINHMNYPSKMDIFVFKCKKMCKYGQIMNCISFLFLYCCPNFILSKKLSRCDTYLIFIFAFLDHIEFCKVVLNISKVSIEYSVHSAHLGVAVLTGVRQKCLFGCTRLIQSRLIELNWGLEDMQCLFIDINCSRA